MTGSKAAPAPSTACSNCGTQLAPSLTSCPLCHTMVHTTRVDELAVLAHTASESGDLSASLAYWREVLELLPPSSKEYQAVASRIDELGRQVDGMEKKPKPPDDRPLHKKAWGGVVAAALFLLSKIKLLLLGLTKATTFLSMLVYFGVYWELWGWKFALGLVVSIYIHEMGHIAAFRRYGMKTTAPMFIPGFGALIRYRQTITDPRQEARVGLAGPVWGLGAALASYAIYLATGSESWAAIAKMGGWINLFNLIPVWQLDGAHGFKSLTREARWIAVAAIVGAWLVTKDSMLILLGAAAVFQALGKQNTKVWDSVALASYVGLVWVLSWLAVLGVRTS